MFLNWWPSCARLCLNSYTFLNRPGEHWPNFMSQTKLIYFYDYLILDNAYTRGGKLVED